MGTQASINRGHDNVRPRRPGKGSGRWLRSTLAMMVFVGTLAGSLLLPATANAASQTWTGKGDGTSWGDPGNWSNGVPHTGDSVTIAPTPDEYAPGVTGVPAGVQLANLTLTDSSLAGGAVTVTNSFTWTVNHPQAALSAPLTVEGSALINGAGQKNSLAPLNLQGTTHLAAGVLTEGSKASIRNSGSLALQAGVAIEGLVCCATPDRFVNAGTLVAPASGAATLTGMDVRDQGNLSVGKGGMLHVTIGPWEFSPGVTVTGGGTVQFDQQSQVALAAGVTIGAGTTVQLTGAAAFKKTGAFIGHGRFLWTGGAIDGNLDIASTLSTAITGTAVKAFTSPTSTPTVLALHGHTTIQGPGPLELSGTTRLKNTGALTLRAGATIEGMVCCVSPDQFTNTGTMTVSAGASAATIGSLAFANSGAVKVSAGTLAVNTLSYKQTAGSTTLAGGSLSAQRPVAIAGGLLTGHGVLAGSVVNGGTVKPSTTGGVLTLTGSYAQTKSGTLSSAIAGTSPGAKYGQLIVGASANLAGRLSISAVNGFTPKSGQSLVILKCQSRTGKFPTLSGSPKFTVRYGATFAKVAYP